MSKFSDKKKQRYAYIRQLLEKYSSNGKIECQICLRKIPSRRSDCNDSRKTHVEWAATHPYMHFNEDLFECQRCGKKKAMLYNIQQHIRRDHKAKFSGPLVIDRTDDYHAEIMKIYSECFDLEEEEKKSEEKANSEDSSPTISSTPSTSCG